MMGEAETLVFIAIVLVLGLGGLYVVYKNLMLEAESQKHKAEADHYRNLYYTEKGRSNRKSSFECAVQYGACEDKKIAAGSNDANDEGEKV